MTTVERAGQSVMSAAQLVTVDETVTWTVETAAGAEVTAGAAEETATALGAWICPSPIWVIGADAMTAVAMKAAAANEYCILKEFKFWVKKG